MMMPANFTAVNSEVVYGGADLFSILADTTAPIWNAANVKKFNTNVITLVSNSFFQKAVNSTLGVMFSGNWGDDNKIFGDEGSLKTNFYGDVNGDGAVTSMDLLYVKRHILGTKLLEEPYLTAADANRGNDGITSIDLLYIKRHILDIRYIEQ